jgi:TonB family protein
MVLLMLYTVAVAALVGLAAAGVEGALRLYRRPGRWAWVAALVASAAAPWVGPRLVGTGGVSPGSESALVVGAAPSPVAAVSRAGGVRDRIAPALHALDRPARAAWLATSGVALIVVLGAAASLARRRRTWRRGRVDGREVLVAPDIGPALVGFPRGVIVLPQWALEVEASVRDLMLRHEEEHRRAGDHGLLVLGVALLVAMPWNPALWRQVRRLRLAVELDCDGRVLRARPGVPRYGAVLLDVAGRSSRLRLLPAFSEGPSFLERRIRAMTARQPEHRALRAAALATLAAAGIGIACELPAPTLPHRPASADDAMAAHYRSPDGSVVELANLGEVEAARTAWYPPLLRAAGIGGTVHVWTVIGADGRVLRRRIDRSSGEGPLDLAAIRVADLMRFRPVGRPGDSVSVPITFGTPPTAQEACLRAFTRMATRMGVDTLGAGERCARLLAEQADLRSAEPPDRGR